MKQSNIEAIYPLTPMQQGMLFHHLTAPHAGTYLLRVVYDHEGSLETEALQQACREVIDRHGVLRTVFVWKKREKPIQLVLKRVALPWHELDWTGETPARVPALLEGFLASDREQGFDLSKPPLLRLTLIHMADGAVKLIWTTHHILLDGWCLQLLLREVLATYQAILRKDSHRPTAPRPFRDYVAWLQRQDMDLAQSFWRDYLAGLRAPTPLPVAGQARAAQRPNRQLTCQFSLSRAAHHALEQAARREQWTLNTVIQGAWALMLGLYNGEGDIVYGLVVSGRPPSLPGSTEMVGLFINTLPARAQLPREGTPNTWLSAYQRRLLALARFDFSSLIDIQGWSDVPRDLPLFKTAFSFQLGANPSTSNEEDRDPHIVPVSDPVDFPLVLRVHAQGRHYELLFDENRLPQDLVIRMAHQLRFILDEMAHDPRQAWHRFRAPNPADTDFLERWNQTQTTYEANACFHRLVETQAQNAPDRIALSLDHAFLSYGTLENRANRMGVQLRNQGLRREGRVGLFTAQDFGWITGLLAVMKAGGCYVPLDPEFPAQRLADLVDEAGIEMIMTSNDLQGKLAGLGCTVMLLDSPQSAAADRQPELDLDPDNLAYMIFTSGSTGRPKGVALAHRGMCNLVRAQTDILRLSPGNRIIQNASMNYDASIYEIVMALAPGATLCLGRKHQFLPGDPLAGFLRERFITNLTITPSALALVPDHGLTHLKTIVAAGEACPAALVARWAPNRRFINGYGPTETTVWASAGRCEGREPLPPIGKPIPNLCNYVLDEALRPVPIGAPGGLYVSGPGLARGYHGRAELTAETFLPDAMSLQPGGRFYQTGDRVYLNPEGELVFLGRRDHQVKIHGIRVELGEIVATFKKHLAIREAVVTAQPRLVAYLVARARVSPSELRDFLADRLPQHMIPNEIVMLESLPLNASGKVDLRALDRKRPSKDAQTAPRAQTAPDDPLATQLAPLWAAVLEREHIGIHDDFYDLGGHSLLAIQLVSQSCEILAIEQEHAMNLFLQNPTIAAFVKAYRRYRDHPADMEETLDLDAEIALDSEIRPSGKAKGRDPRTILLTGATGFIGAFLLDEILRRTAARVRCLVRAPSVDRAMGRLRDNLEAYGLHFDWSRVEAIGGDLAKPRLGLSPSEFQSLARETDLIFHNGAYVHFFFPYNTLKPANVLGTKELLRLACLAQPIPFHHISTMSVLAPATAGSGTLREDDALTEWHGLRNGYAQSKWVAERLVQIARDRGLPTAIYRLGRITGHGQTGACHPGDLTIRLIQSFATLGLAPAGEMPIEMTPVDFLCRAVVHLAGQPGSFGRVFHLYHPQPIPLTRLIGWMNDWGYRIRQVPADQWLQKVRAAGEDEADNPLAPVMSFLGGGEDSAPAQTRPHFDQANLVRALKDSGISLPPIDERLLETYFRYMTGAGLLPRPSARAAKLGQS